ncbi:MAG: hypothetical protein AAB373_05095 [Patescibacteria group bacterium]
MNQEDYYQKLKAKIVKTESGIDLLKKVVSLCLDLQRKKSSKSDIKELAKLEQKLKSL